MQGKHIIYKQVEKYANVAAFPTSGNEYLLYYAQDTDSFHVWNGATYEATNAVPTAHTHTASEITDFDTEVSNNPSVTANTAKVTNQTHTGDVTGATTLTIANNAVTNAKVANDAITNTKLANMATQTIKGRNTVGTGDPEDLTAATVRTILNVREKLNNFVVVKQKSDLPTPAAGVITLAASTVYLINGSINLGTDRLVLSGDARILGNSAFTDNIIYTGSSAMITCTDFNISISNLALIANTASSQILNASNAAQTKSCVVQDCLFTTSQKAGTISGFNNVLLNVISYQTVLDGWDINNTTHLFILNQNYEETCTGTYIDISTGTFEVIVVRNNIFHVDTSNTALDIDAGTITVNSCSIIANTFLGTGTYIDNFTVNNSDFVVKANSGLASFTAKASMTLSSITANLNVTASTWTKINGTTTLDVGERFSMPVNNRLMYDGAEPIDVSVNVALAGYYTAGGARIAEISIFKNGVLVGGSQNGFTIYNADEPCSTNAQVSMVTGDYIEVYFQKFGGPATDDFEFSFLNVQINEL